MSLSRVKVFLLPNGKLPERKSYGAVGYDVCIRAVVSPTEMDPINPHLRKTLFDFKIQPEDPYTQRHVFYQSNENNLYHLVYQMDPGESVLVGIGFCTQLDFPWFYWIAPRSGLASRYGLTVTNAPGTVDPDYRGEAGVLIYNRNATPFRLSYGMRIAQIIFQKAATPKFDEVRLYSDLLPTARGNQGFGSTGIR